MSELITTQDVAERWSIPERTVRYHAANGEIPAVRIGRQWRFDPDELEDYLDAQRVNGQS